MLPIIPKMIVALGESIDVVEIVCGIGVEIGGVD
jgi:hypothetical protein